MELDQILYRLLEPIVENQDGLNVSQLESLDENEIILLVHADSPDIARLIGRQGFMARSIRQTMSIASRVMDKRINVKFEAY